jgi:hypothetical protein
MADQKLHQTVRMVAWATHHGLVKSDADICLRTVLNKRCLFGNAQQQDEEGPHGFYNDHGCRTGSHDDNVTLWYIPNTTPTIYVYTFHEYTIPSPSSTQTAIDGRGVKHSIHPHSWYHWTTSMHVVTRPTVENTFAYNGELPRDLGDFSKMYYQATKLHYQSPLMPKHWTAFIAEQHEHRHAFGG